jgi:hypothetical protein
VPSAGSAGDATDAASAALDAAVAAVARVFAGRTAKRDESGCARCHSADEIVLLRTPDVPLPEDLVREVAREDPRRWDDQPAVIRRVLPQLTVRLAAGDDDAPLLTRGLAAAGWQRWPHEEAMAVAGFLDAWWTRALREEPMGLPARGVFESCVTATSSVTPWLALWDAEPGPAARRLTAEAVSTWWQDELAADRSPFTWWWGPEAAERAAWRELKGWLAERT